MKKYLLILGATVAITAYSSQPITGEQYADCAGNYFTAAVVSAIDNDDENKIYFTLLALVASNKSYDFIGYEQSKQITNAVVQKYTNLMAQNRDFMTPLVANVQRCDKLATKK